MIDVCGGDVVVVEVKVCGCVCGGDLWDVVFALGVDGM